ncbi:hypothetical protein [Rhizobium tropici]|jgi:hypothetical protein|uniref:hypothetical protein n=1 Tax=Rhizobium sp. 11_C7_N12_5 TaxID=3240770 RepID=UPI0012E05CC7
MILDYRKYRFPARNPLKAPVDEAVQRGLRCRNRHIFAALARNLIVIGILEKDQYKTPRYTLNLYAPPTTPPA